VENAPPQSTIIVATEVNLVGRRAKEYPDKEILDLHYSLCPNMFKISLKNLLNALDNIGQVNVIEVPENIKRMRARPLIVCLPYPKKQVPKVTRP